MRLAPATHLVGKLLNFDSSVGVSYPTPSPFGLGQILMAEPTDGADFTANVPNWGPSELMFVRYVGGTALAPGRLVVVDKDWTITDMPNTGNTGRQVYVTLSRFEIGSVTAQYGWVMRSGVAPIQATAGTATGPVYFSAAGQANSTAAAGKQILNMSTLLAPTSSFTRQVTTQNGSKKLKLARVNGLFVGQAVSGTGIAGSSVIASIDPGGNFVMLNNNMTATGTVTGTFTATGFFIAQFDRPFVQGQIT